MDEKNIDKKWNKILEISDSMLSLANNAQWDPLIEMESNRQDLLQQYFKAEIQIDKLEVVKQGINFILKVDKEISELVKQQSVDIKNQLSKLKNNRIAISQYNKNSS